MNDLKSKSGLYLVPANGHPESLREIRRVVRNGYVADIVMNHSRELDTTLFHYIIHLEGCAEILHWGQEATMQRAYACIDEFIDYKQRKHL